MGIAGPSEPYLYAAKRGQPFEPHETVLLAFPYEISFTRHFYKPQPLRTLEEIRADILAVEKEAEGLLDDLLASETK